MFLYLKFLQIAESTLKKANNGAISKINSFLPPIRILSNFCVFLLISEYSKKPFKIE